MITGRMRIQLAVFLAIAVAGIIYVGGQYVGLGRLFGIHGYVVHVNLADSGGIFTNGEVTYRGVTVGRISDLHLTPTGVRADLDIDSSAPRIPASARAVVADRSAVGEQYVDLEPPNDNGPTLHDGSVITQDHTDIPLAPQTLLSDLDTLANSVPTDALRTVVDQLGTAFNGTGPDLRALLNAANSLTATATTHLPETISLFADGRTVLTTQEAQAQQLIDFSTSLNQLAAQLRTSDPTIRSLITTAPQAATAIDAVLHASGNDLGVVFANLLTTAKVAETRTSDIAQALVEYPIAAAIGKSASPDGTGHLGFVLDFFDPMPCTKGYEGTVQHAGTDVTNTTPVNANAYCALPPQSGVDVRGSNNAPFGGVPQEVAPPAAPTATTPVVGNPTTPTTLAGLLGLAATH